MSLSAKQRTDILTAIKQRVLKSHFNVAAANLAVWTKQIDDRTPALLSMGEDDFENGVRQIVAELGGSHTAFYHERANRILPPHSVNATLRRFTIEGVERWIFLDVFEEGPAHQAGIRQGEVLEAVDGTSCIPPAVPVLRLGQTYNFVISAIRGRSPRTVVVTVPFRKGTKERPPIIEPKSPIHRMVGPGIGLLKIPYFPDPTGLSFAKALDSAIHDLKSQRCRRLIIDLRGNIGGSLGFARLASYLCPDKIPLGHSLTPARLRAGYDRNFLPQVPMPATRAGLFLALARFAIRDKSVMLLTQDLGPQPFHGNVVVLVNEFTNSAGEMVASFASENRLATLVGTASAGNVLGAVNFRLAAGYWLRLPVFGWYTGQGRCLEGTGVAPDIRIEPDVDTLATGIDRGLETAIEILSGRPAHQ